MKTKTFEIHPELIKLSILNLLVDGKKITKKSVMDNLNHSLKLIITNGHTELCPFPLDNMDDYFGDEYYPTGKSWDEIEDHYNRLFK